MTGLSTPLCASKVGKDSRSSKVKNAGHSVPEQASWRKQSSLPGWRGSAETRRAVWGQAQHAKRGQWEASELLPSLSCVFSYVLLSLTPEPGPHGFYSTPVSSNVQPCVLQWGREPWGRASLFMLHLPRCCSRMVGTYLLPGLLNPQVSLLR